MRILKILSFLFCANFSLAQQTQWVDFLKCKADLAILPSKKEVSGSVSYSFKIKNATDSIFIDAKNMSFEKVYINKSKATFKVSPKKLWLYNKFKKNTTYTVAFNYVAAPKKAMYFIDWHYIENPEAKPQVWTQGQGKDNSNWIPSFDDMNEKVTFDLSVSFDKDYEVIANGKLVAKTKKKNTIVKWQYRMTKPMSSYLLAIAIGKYQKNSIVSKNGIPLEIYYYPKDSLKLEPTYRYSKQLFDFLEAEIGLSYPWQNYKQVPVKDFLYAGMENTSMTIFSDAFVVDSTAFVDKNYVNINAHELAHQWFGDLVTETHGTHHWLQEGFATYYALLAEKELFGADYFYYKLYEYSQQLIKAQLTDTIPLMNPKASALTFYQKGAWALYTLRERVGDHVFKTAVKKYLTTYQFKNVATNDFISIVAKESQQDLSDFVATWLLSNKFNKVNADKVFNKINSESVYYKLLKLNQVDFVPNWSVKDKHIKVRQQLAQKLQSIPESLKAEYQSLLYDDSYQTIETALYNLWYNFPQERMKYLNTTKNITGFNDKNIRTLWLALALNTKGFTKNEYTFFYDELIGYTNPVFHFEVRKNAFQYLKELDAFNTKALQNLKQASKHHQWRFRSYCKNLYEYTTKQN